MTDDLRGRRRAAARRHHPDVGGDPDAFVEAMASLSPPAATTARGDVVLTTSARSRVKRTLTTTRKNLAARLGRRAPWTKRERFAQL